MATHKQRTNRTLLLTTAQLSSLQMRSKGYHSPALPPHRLPSQQSVLALNPVAFEIAWNFAQLSVPQTSPDAQPTLSHGSQSAQQSITHGVAVWDSMQRGSRSSVAVAMCMSHFGAQSTQRKQNYNSQPHASKHASRQPIP